MLVAVVDDTSLVRTVASSLNPFLCSAGESFIPPISQGMTWPSPHAPHIIAESIATTFPYLTIVTVRQRLCRDTVCLVLTVCSCRFFRELTFVSFDKVCDDTRFIVTVDIPSTGLRTAPLLAKPRDKAVYLLLALWQNRVKTWGWQKCSVASMLPTSESSALTWVPYLQATTT